MNKSKKLIFFGNERLATGVSTTAPLLQALIKDGYEICAVVSNFTKSQSRSARELEIEVVAKAHNIPLLLPENLGQIAEQLEDYQAQAGILAAYGKIIPQAIIDIFPRGIINLHPSLLPLYRGSTPIETAMLSGDKATGVSVMNLVAKMDAGAVYAQQEVALSGTETKQELADSLGKLGAKLLAQTLPDILDGKYLAKPQNHAKATYTKRIAKEDGILDWSKPVENLEREVRAYAGWPKSVTRVYGQKIIVTKAKVVDGLIENELVMHNHAGFLQIEELVAESGRTMSGADFVRGYKK
jgi:methionyl-tRNA formyltransferase